MGANVSDGRSFADLLLWVRTFMSENVHVDVPASLPERRLHVC